MNTQYPSRRRLVPQLIILVLIFTLGYNVGSRHGANLYSSEAIGDADFTPYWKTWSILNEKFVSASTTTVTDQEKVWQSIVGLADAYNDPYTVFFPPEETKAFEESISNNFEGVGMEIGKRDDIITVIAPLKGTPADRAGMRPGDQILKIDDALTNQFSVSDAVQRIRGERGTTVVLTVLREGVDEAIEVSIVRDVINVPSIEVDDREDGVFVIHLYNFTGQSEQQFERALNQFKESGKRRLVLDLRGNPGGFLAASVEMASYFLPQGKIVVSEDFGKSSEIKHLRSKGYDLGVSNLEIVVLIDGGSASASEILAGALREHGVATLIGETSFGKGSVQQVVDITRDTSLKVTVARWLTPEGHSISEGGVAPDIEVLINRDTLVPGTDPQLERAIEYLLER